jgi:antitoxin ParD1/3/4
MFMSPATLHISLTESLKQRIKERVEEDHFSNPSDYLRALVREDLKRRDEKRLEAMLLEGLASGPGMTLDSPEWDDFWRRIESRIANKQQPTEQA